MKINNRRGTLKDLNDKHKLNSMSTELDFLDQILAFINNQEKVEQKYIQVQQNESSKYLAKLKAKRLRVEELRTETLKSRLSVLADQLEK